jgi:hypothetical protein
MIVKVGRFKLIFPKYVYFVWFSTLEAIMIMLYSTEHEAVKHPEWTWFDLKTFFNIISIATSVFRVRYSDIGFKDLLLLFHIYCLQYEMN